MRSETFLLEQDLGERTLTHRLAVHLEKQFPGWEVDCDYDRLGERTLRLPHGTIVSTDDHLAKSIYPDIVVHQRAIPNNLLAIEVRKATNHQPPEHDRHKLRALTDPHLWFAYWIGRLSGAGQEERRLGRLCRRRDRRAVVGVAGGPAEGCAVGAKLTGGDRRPKPPHANSASGISRASRARSGASRSAWFRHLPTDDE